MLGFLLLASSTYCVIIECDYSVEYWNPIGDYYTCVVKEITSGNSTIVEDIRGTHVSEKSDGDVQGFLNSKHGKGSIPKNIGKFLKNITVFQWSESNLEVITAGDLKPFPNLVILYLSENKIVSLSSDLFKHTPKLQRIMLHSNKIEHIGHDLLTGLVELTFVHIHYNRCIDALADTPEAIQELNLQLPISCPPLATTSTPKRNHTSLREMTALIE